MESVTGSPGNTWTACFIEEFVLLFCPSTKQGLPSHTPIITIFLWGQLSPLYTCMQLLATGLLNLSITDMSAQVNLGCVCPLHCKMLSRIPYQTSVASLLKSVTTKDVSRYCQTSPGAGGRITLDDNPGDVGGTVRTCSWLLCPALTTRGLPRPHYGSILAHIGRWEVNHHDSGGGSSKKVYKKKHLINLLCRRIPNKLRRHFTLKEGALKNI